MSLHGKTISCAIAVFCILERIALASAPVLPYTPRNYFEPSDLIIIGEALNSSGKQTDSVQVRVLETIKGNPDTRTIRIATKMTQPSATGCWPRFTVGDKSLIFLKKRDGDYVVLYQGCGMRDIQGQYVLLGNDHRRLTTDVISEIRHPPPLLLNIFVVSPRREVIYTGEQVDIRVWITNWGDDGITIDTPLLVGRDLTFVVTEESTSTSTNLWNSFPEDSHGQSELVFLGPYTSEYYTRDVSLFGSRGLDVPGAYAISAQYDMLSTLVSKRGKSHQPIKSNVIFLQVVDRERQDSTRPEPEDK